MAEQHKLLKEEILKDLEIGKYEELLDLKEIKEPFLNGKKEKVFTATFIQLMELLIALVAIVLLIRTIID